MNYISIIGLEIHIELLTKTKLFCACENSFGGKPNSRVCPVCTGMPGSLPTLNLEAVVLAAKAGFALNSTVHNEFSFDRKNYFYPDLPKAYQISQLYKPICTGGNIGKIRINNIHIEEDAGKLIHKNHESEIDLNRCGVPLIEIVTEPDFRTITDVEEFLSALARRLKYSGVSDCKMEQGSLRVDVNISLMRPDDEKFGERAEIKNLNSFRSIRRAIEFEIKRQSEVLDSGKPVIRETRRFDENKGITVSMRTKEEATDYRYFPEPDIPPVFIDDDTLQYIKKSLPQMPEERLFKYVNDFNLPEADAQLLVEDKDFSDFFEGCLRELNNPRELSKLLLGEFSHRLNISGVKICDLKFSAKDFSYLTELEISGKINKAEQKEILKIMFESEKKPADIIKTIKRDVSEDEIKAKITALAEANEKLVLEYKNGSLKCVDFFMGQIIRTFGKSVNPKTCKELIISILDSI